MARGTQASSTPRQSASQKAASQSSSKNQKTLFGFFQKKPTTELATSASSTLTPAPSSDGAIMSSPSPGSTMQTVVRNKSKENGLPSPISPADSFSQNATDHNPNQDQNSARRKTKKPVNYIVSDDDGEEEDDEVFKPLSSHATNARASKRRKVSSDESEDEFTMDKAADVPEPEDEDMEDFDVSEDEDESGPKKRKRNPSSKSRTNRRSSAPKSSPPALEKIPTEDMEIPVTSTAQQWNFDPEGPSTSRSRKKQKPAPEAKNNDRKMKAHMTEPAQRYTWLDKVLDKERHPPDHPDYDPRTLYVPPIAWSKFSPFEKQYWEIKQNFMDTIVFFKKGKFYELYENDAVVGHQLFDLKKTDRVNMSMVGVPEASLDYWACQFVAKGFKIARVDQMESALAKEMRERGGPVSKKAEKEEKVIRRELASVLTGGTLVDAGMLQGDMSTYCVAIKEIDQDNLPAFGIAFVDTATAQFSLTSFVDDADLTRFETFVAQIRPAELLLEKSCISARAIRILKSNTGPTTIWNYLKPNSEFWPAHITAREIDATDYFSKENTQDVEMENDKWPKALKEARDKDLVLSAFGALLQYLKKLKLDRDLVSLGNFTWYDPIRRGSTLVLDGQSLINLEIFANSVDGGSEGTLFTMLNHCVTPFGKRMMQSWVCHPLADSRRIEARLDAVEALLADPKFMDQFMASLTKLPDLERLISRVHANRCRAQEFVKVLEGFEQIEYTISLLKSFGEGEGLIGQLIASMPNLYNKLQNWKSAFDKTKARDSGILVPEPGIEEDYDSISEQIEQCESALNKHLQRVRKDLESSVICYRDNGKEIYQLEVPLKIKNIPKDWDQMSATAKVKRYYNPELRKLVRNLQEARESHAQIVKEVAGRFYSRFDEDYGVWLAAVRIVSQLDCLVSLARASASLGAPSCRPELVDEPRNGRDVVDFRELRHPTMLTTVSDFIPNDVALGGPHAPNINLLTGANAAGKSTVLRMTCIAVILAQLGCYVPASSAVLTPRDRIMSRLGANDNILAQQSTFFVELSETKKILSEATPRSLVILDELGRGTSSVDGLAVAEAVLHHVASHVGCLGFFATHYHSLALEFTSHPEVAPKCMKIAVDEASRRVTFLYRLQEGVAEGSFGMHCASMCGIPADVVDKATEAANKWEHSGRVEETIEKNRGMGRVGLGWLSDVSWALKNEEEEEEEEEEEDDGGDMASARALDVLLRAVDTL